MNEHAHPIEPSGDTAPEPAAEAILEEARQRLEARKQAEAAPELSQQQRSLLRTVNHLIYQLCKHWVALFNLVDGLYVGGSFLAPILMQTGHEGAAAVVYRFYKLFCHQYPVRSWFLQGGRIVTYGAASTALDAELQYARDFIGNATLGYKVAFCQRDVAIYGAILVAGLLYGLLRHRWRSSIPWWVYIFVGLVPMGVDGGYQIISQLLGQLHLFPWLPVYESTALMRALTGAAFGATTVAFIYPQMNEFFEETKALLSSRYGWK
jgi:uncharacterized membrane protein